MTEENKPIEEKLEEKPSFLDEVRKEKEELAKIRDDLKELRAKQILSGEADAGQEPEKPKEETAQEYGARMLKGV